MQRSLYSGRLDCVLIAEMTSFMSSIAALPQALQAWFSGSKSVDILLTGKSGVGKSSLINCIVGAVVAPEGHGLDPETKAVTPFKVEINGVEITVWDSPGLQDGTKNEEKYLDDMKRQCKSYDLVLYCTKMIDTRLGEDDHEAMKKLTKAFGESVWEHAVVVTTFANYIPTTTRKDRERYTAKYELFKKTLPEKLKGTLKISAEVAEAVPVMPAGYVDPEDPDSRQLPNCRDWLSALWYVAILRMKEGAQPAMLKASMSRIKSPDSITEEDLKKPGPEQPIAAVPPTIKYGTPPTVMVALGALLGVFVAGPVGAAIGGAAGGAAGAAVDVVIAFFSC